MQKRYQLKIYSLDGTYIKTINPDQIKTEVRFSSKTNGGQGQCSIDLNLPMDDFDEGVSIKHMNVVKVYEMDDMFNLTPLLIYTGFISQYSPYFNQQGEGVKLSLLGMVSLLSFGYYKSGGAYTFTESSKDPAEIMRRAITHYNSVYSGNWITTGSNCVDVGTNVTYEIADQKWYDVLKKSYDLAGGGRYWTIRETGEVYFKAKPASATHLFTIGKDVDSGEVIKNSEKIVNQFQLRWSSTTNYSDPISIANFGLREKVQNDSRITLVATADLRGNGEITDGKDFKIEAKLRINSNYNIESIHPGDTCTVANVKKGSIVFSDNMIITAVNYDPDGVSIDLENDQVSFADIFNNAVENKILSVN